MALAHEFVGLHGRVGLERWARPTGATDGAIGIVTVVRLELI